MREDQPRLFNASGGTSVQCVHPVFPFLQAAAPIALFHCKPDNYCYLVLASLPGRGGRY